MNESNHTTTETPEIKHESYKTDQEVAESYDFSEKSKNYYQPPIPAYMPPPLLHHPLHEHPGLYGHPVHFSPTVTFLLPLVLMVGAIIGLCLIELKAEPEDTVYLANYSAPIVTVNVNTTSDSDSSSSSAITYSRNDTDLILGYIYPNGTIENITLLIPTFGGFGGFGGIGNLGGIILG